MHRWWRRHSHLRVQRSRSSVTVQPERISGGQVLHLWVLVGVLAPVIRRGRFLTPSQFLTGGPVVLQWVILGVVKPRRLVLNALDARGIIWESVGQRPATCVEQWVISRKTAQKQERKNPEKQIARPQLECSH